MICSRPNARTGKNLKVCVQLTKAQASADARRRRAPASTS